MNFVLAQLCMFGPEGYFVKCKRLKWTVAQSSVAGRAAPGTTI